MRCSSSFVSSDCSCFHHILPDGIHSLFSQVPTLSPLHLIERNYVLYSHDFLPQASLEEADSYRNTVLREAAINVALDHSNIVATYTYDMQPLVGDSALCDWQMYIIQEFCDGGTLLSAINNGTFFMNEAGFSFSPRLDIILPLLSQIACGCAYIHSKNIIHGRFRVTGRVLNIWMGTRFIKMCP